MLQGQSDSSRRPGDACPSQGTGALRPPMGYRPSSLRSNRLERRQRRCGSARPTNGDVAASCHQGALMNADRCADVTEPRPPGEHSMADLYGMEFALDVVAPEIKKPAQLGKIRGKIELLPDEALQQIGMIGKMVDDLRGGQPILAKSWPGIAHIGSPPLRSRQVKRMPVRSRYCNKKANYNNLLAADPRDCCQPARLPLLKR